MHDALAISDILSSVFKFTDTETDVECVRVCKAWHEPALDALWYRVNKLEQLFKLLGPMRELSPGLQVRSLTLANHSVLRSFGIDFSSISYLKRALGAVLLLCQPCEATRMHGDLPNNPSPIFRDYIHFAPYTKTTAEPHTFDMENRARSTHCISYALPSVLEPSSEKSCCTHRSVF